MDELVVLDAVAVAALAQTARVRISGEPGNAGELHRLATELDEIADTVVALDQHDHEIEHQLRWWQARAAALEAALTGSPADDVETVRELALYRGRMSGAHTMRRHYVEQRNALLARHLACAADLAEL